MMSASPYKTKSLLETRPDGIEFEKWQGHCNLLAKNLRIPVIQIKQANENGIECLSANQHPHNPYHQGACIPLSDKAYCHNVVRYNDKLYIANANTMEQWKDNADLKNHGLSSYLGIPLNWPDGTVFGAVTAHDTKPINNNENTMAIFLALKNHIDTELKYIHILQKYELLSEIDEMTNLKNRRGFFKNAEQLCEIARRENRPITICYFDLNNLKYINESQGRETGDLYISSFAAALTEITRRSDIVGRLGGDEFALLSLMPDGAMAAHVVQRLREAFNAWLEDSTIETNSTFSVGFKTFDVPHKLALEEMLTITDKLMLQQKLASREKIVSLNGG